MKYVEINGTCLYPLLCSKKTQSKLSYIPHFKVWLADANDDLDLPEERMHEYIRT